MYTAHNLVHSARYCGGLRGAETPGCGRGKHRVSLIRSCGGLRAETPGCGRGSIASSLATVVTGALCFTQTPWSTFGKLLQVESDKIVHAAAATASVATNKQQGMPT
eukprot:g4139.t1